MQSKLEVLVVDDEDEIVEEIIDALDSEGFHCHGARSVDAALVMFHAKPNIKLILTDLKMPGKSGHDLIIETQKIRGRQFNVIVATGHLEHGFAEIGQEEGVFAVLRKPLAIEELLDTLQRAGRQLASPCDRPESMSRA